MKKKALIILISISAAIMLLAGGIFLFLRNPKEAAPDPRALLHEATRYSEQNLCLMAILQQDPKDRECWAQLLANYRALGADPLTLAATEQAAQRTIGEIPKGSAEAAPEPAGALFEAGGIAQGGRRAEEFKDALAIATDGNTTYIAKPDGIYADFKGLSLKLSPAPAERMIAAENGLYYLNGLTHRIQYIARDGHKTKTLSERDAKDFIFWDQELWLVDQKGAIYCRERALDCPPCKALIRAGNHLYAAAEEGGLLQLQRSGTFTVITKTPLYSPIGSASGSILYLNEQGFPCCYDPIRKESVILKEIKALAVDEDGGKIYYLNERNKLKKQ